MRTVVSKIYHTVRNEGVGSVLDRTARYLAYKYKRLRTDRKSVFEEWRKLEGRFAGERAFLIGNGPSLNQTPLYLLSEEHTMCFNRWDLMLERLAWMPTFYTVIDDRVLMDTAHLANGLARVADYAFFPDIHPYNVDFRPVIKKRENVYWLFLDRTSFSMDLPYCGINKTVANVGLQILAYLGFDEIYLLGVDMSYTLPDSAKVSGSRDVLATEDDDESHFDPRYFGKGRKYHVPMLDETFAKFREAEQFFSRRGVKIYNATVGGRLEEFERIDLETVLNMSREEKRRRFQDNVRAHLKLAAGDLDRLMDEAPVRNEADGSDRELRAFRTSADRIHEFLRPYIFDFVPFGPYEETYLYVNRDLLVPPPVTSQNPR
jgi:hypothetical protein